MKRNLLMDRGPFETAQTATPFLRSFFAGVTLVGAALIAMLAVAAPVRAEEDYEEPDRYASIEPIDPSYFDPDTFDPGTRRNPLWREKGPARSRFSGKLAAPRPVEVTTEEGYFFLDGEYIPPPYVIRSTETAAVVNGHEIRSLAPEFDDEDDPRRSRRLSVADRHARQLGDCLEQGGILFSFASQPIVEFNDQGGQYDVLKLLTAKSRPAEIKRVSSRIQLPERFDRRVWDQWVGSYVAPKALLARVEPLIVAFEQSEAIAIAEVAATQRLNKFSYPLTLGGMLITVLSIGHLLSNRPPKAKSALAMNDDPETLSVATYSLMLVGLLSCLDLVWTLLASQAGQMRELNPVGSHLISDPLMLIVFKVSVTGMAIGLLFFLRRFVRAQTAAWWACLICTMLAVRWLTFNSMFISA